MTKPFGGDGFEKDEFTDLERAQLRHMKHEVSESWPALRSIAQFLKSMKGVTAVIGSCIVIGGAIAWMIRQGFFQ